MRPEATSALPSAMESTIVVASNRGPVSFDRDASGVLVAQRGAGGLVTALSGVFFRDDTTWVAAAMTDGDREVAAEGYEIDPDSHQRVRFVVIPPDRYDAYYNQMSNRILWFLHHYLWDTARTPTFDETTEATWQEFVEANRSFAIALAEEGRPRSRLPDPGLPPRARPRDVARAPSRMRASSTSPTRRSRARRTCASCRRICATRSCAAWRAPTWSGSSRDAWVESYLLSVRGLPGFRVLRGGRFAAGDRVATARAFPVAVSAHPIRETAARPEIKQVRRDLEEWKGNRQPPSPASTGSSRRRTSCGGFLAYELFLQSNPSWQGRVRFLALFSPSREALPEYQAYGDDCLAEVERINKELSTEDWQPIEVRIQEDYGYAVGAYGLYDVLLVNPVYDGMNLVAMEGPLVNRHVVPDLVPERRRVRQARQARAHGEPVRHPRDGRRDPRRPGDAR